MRITSGGRLLKKEKTLTAWRKPTKLLPITDGNNKRLIEHIVYKEEKFNGEGKV